MHSCLSGLLLLLVLDLTRLCCLRCCSRLSYCQAAAAATAAAAAAAARNAAVADDGNSDTAANELRPAVHHICRLHILFYGKMSLLNFHCWYVVKKYAY